MALINCPECGRQVSDKAAVCPHCGVTIAAKPRKSNRAPIIITAAVIALAIVAVGF